MRSTNNGSAAPTKRSAQRVFSGRFSVFQFVPAEAELESSEETSIISSDDNSSRPENDYYVCVFLSYYCVL